MDWIKWSKKWTCHSVSQSSGLNKLKFSYCKSKCNILLDNISLYCESKGLIKINT